MSSRSSSLRIPRQKSCAYALARFESPLNRRLGQRRDRQYRFHALTGRIASLSCERRSHGHRRPLHAHSCDKGTGPKYDAYDLLVSDSGFAENVLAAVWDNVFVVCVVFGKSESRVNTVLQAHHLGVSEAPAFTLTLLQCCSCCRIGLIFAQIFGSCTTPTPDDIFL